MKKPDLATLFLAGGETEDLEEVEIPQRDEDYSDYINEEINQLQ